MSLSFIAAVLFLAGMLLPTAQSHNDYMGVRKTKCKGATLSKIIDVKSISKCKTLCDNYPGLCKAITYNTEDNICYLKLDCEKKSEVDEGFNSAVRKGHYTKVAKTKCADTHVTKIEGISTLAACSNECDHVKQCEAISFFDKGKDCYLLKECDEPFDEPDFTTLIKKSDYTVYNGVQCEENNFKDIQGVHSFDSCELECDTDSRCAVATYDNKANICYLMESCEDQSGKNGPFDSAVKRQPYKILEQTTCKGDTMERFKGVNSFNDCLAICDRYKKCDGLTYDKENSVCHIKETSCHNRKEAKGFKSAIRK